jgi:hypothetical protein
MNSSTAASWTAAIGTLSAVLVALFKEEIQSLFFKPKFKVEVRTRLPFCVKASSVVYTTTAEGHNQVLWSGSIYYARLWVQNAGNRRAESVEVFITKVERITRDRSYEPIEGFVPSNLRWANTDPIRPEIFHAMNPEMGRYCDLGAIADPACTTLKEIPGVPKGTATFDLVLQTALPSDAHRLPPGDYRLTLKVSAANAQPLELNVNVSISGNWTEDEEMMFTKELGVSIAAS